ncbi:MAG TPA: EAL domain-containing protein [Bacilli bacterium]
MLTTPTREKIISKILVVDDRNENLFAMEKLLKTLDCEVLQAHSGNEAMSFTLRHDFSLLLLDVNMPEMNGFELAELLRGNTKTRQIPIIFLTGHNKEDTHLFKAYETGAVDYLFKPVDTDILLSKVKIFLELDLRKKELEAIKTELEQSNNSLKHMAYHDYLTDLPNRRALEKRLETIFGKGPAVSQGTALMKIALDQFQVIIDTLGQKTGDILLEVIAARLSNLLNNHEFLTRIGETKFAIIVQHQTDYEYCNQLSLLIIDCINEPVFINGYELYITANIGISKYQEKPESYEQLMQHANTALSLAKAKGKNRIDIYSISMDIKSYKHFSISNDIRKALERNELHLLYQPIIDVYSNQKIVGAEALLRWNHPEWGLVSPSEFIPIAEDTGLIIAIGNWVLRMACGQQKKWREEGFTPIRISVNFSPQQFMQENFTEIVKSILKETDMHPQMLEIEITESLFIHDVHRVSEILQELREWGIRVALDDFGTGYSSLSLLTEFKLDTLKIDKSFIKDFETDVKRSNLVESIIKIGHIMEMNVVAEGVEKVEQYTLLQKYGSNEVQGYYISRPIEQDAFRTLLKYGVSLTELQSSTANRSEVNNRRKCRRIAFSNCFIADMTIDSFHGKELSLGSTKVLISNIGSGGLCFLLHVKMPVGNELRLKFEMEIGNKPFALYGQVIWFNEIEEDKMYEYGVKFVMENLDRDSLASALTTLEGGHL